MYFCCRFVHWLRRFVMIRCVWLFCLNIWNGGVWMGRVCFVCGPEKVNWNRLKVLLANNCMRIKRTRQNIIHCQTIKQVQPSTKLRTKQACIETINVTLLIRDRSMRSRAILFPNNRSFSLSIQTKHFQYFIAIVEIDRKQQPKMKQWL